MRKEHIKLEEQERCSLTILTTSGELKTRQFKRAMALLLLDQGKTLTEVSKTLKYAYPSLIRLKKNYLESGLKSLEERPRTGRPGRFGSSSTISTRITRVRFTRHFQPKKPFA